MASLGSLPPPPTSAVFCDNSTHPRSRSSEMPGHHDLHLWWVTDSYPSHQQVDSISLPWSQAGFVSNLDQQNTVKITLCQSQAGS